MVEIWPLVNFCTLIVAIVVMLAISVVLRRQLDIIHDTVNSNLSVAQEKLNDALKNIERLEARLVRGEYPPRKKEVGQDE
jgi:hypothetical protein